METNMSRSRWDILYEILAFMGLHKEVVRTKIERHIVFAAKDAKTYLTLLQDQGYMTMTKELYGKRKIYVCTVTPKGLELRDRINDIYNMFGGKRPKW